ncbi:GTPase IMAP family member 8-like [Carassius auratus]|uniref:GTPase IMAP family member 8 n=1 Tax=Carassius auratus TaxID=7957 RepID=A0A6P6LI65_CARAU|nr:GTPase IMAP family member 8-like [Carassius auratus]
MALKGTSQNQRNVKHLFELRIILLGGRNSGKNLVGNGILNQEEFFLHERTTCLKRKAEVQGRSVIVVDTPGWWCDFSAQDTPELVRREIRHSVSLCHPGPHIFLLVVKTDSVFIEKRRRAVEEHLELLVGAVWNHTIVLFTKGKNAGNKSFEDHVQASGKHLQWLLEKCSGRFHVFDTMETCNATQVMELMGKIDQMLAENERCHFEMDVKTLQETEDKKREVELKAHQRLMNIQKQRSLKVHSSHQENIRLILLGAKGSGKSSTGNSVLAAGSDLSFTVNKRTTQCMKETFTVAGRQVTVVDTPGWWMNYFTQDSSAFDKEEIVKSVYLCPPGPHAFLLVVRADRSFTETYRRAIEEHIELISKDIWNHSVVLFTFGDWLSDTTIEQYIESEGKALQWLVERCRNCYHVLNNKSLGNNFQITELLEKIEEMTAGSHFETDESCFKEMKRKQQVEEDSAKIRRENVLRRKQSLRAFKNKVQLPSVIRVFLLGSRHSGKTSSANCILGNDGQEADNQNLMRGTVILNETKVEVMDTPGWTTECPYIAEFRGQLLHDWVSGSDRGIGILLLVVNASSSFTLKNLKAAEYHLCTLGGKAWSSTVVLFTHGDWLGDVNVEQYIESEGDALQTLVEKCGNRYLVFNNKIKDNGTQVTELMQKIEEMMLEQILNNAKNLGNIQRPLVNDKFKFGGKVQIGEMQKTPLRSSTNIHHGDTDIQGEHQMIEISEHLLPSTSSYPKITTTDSIVPPSENQAVSCRSFRLSNRTSLPRNVHQRLVVVLNTSEWFHPNEPWRGVSRTDAPETGSLAAFSVSTTEQPMNVQRLFRNESQGERFWGPSLPYYHRNTPYTSQTAKEKAFMSFIQSEDLQNLIDQWGDSNIEELEAFIDSYFEMVWQEAINEPNCSGMTPINSEGLGITENDQGHLASIDRKLSKLDILEGVQRDLQELKQTIKHLSKIFQELKDRTKETHDPTRSSEVTASAESEETGRSDEK